MSHAYYRGGRSQVLHQLAINHKTGIAYTACGIRVVLPDPGVHMHIRRDDGTIRRLRESGLKNLACWCWHCGNREPPWQKAKRLRRREVERMGK